MTTNRRQFLKTTMVTSAPLFVPATTFGANERLNIGVIGVAGRGGANLDAMTGENVVALCDADRDRLSAAHERHPKAKTYEDYRQLLDEQNLDAVVISTPDHHHAPATMRALERGLHVYCEKPLTHTVEEARLVAAEAARQKVATQMGTQNHQHPGYLRVVEWLEQGVIGDVREAHIITDRPGKWWPQGLNTPIEKQVIPKHLNWDVWLGPAHARDYHAAYVPFKWRGWWDFGCGAIGDMAIHLMDPAFWGLKLAGPVQVTSEGPTANSDSAPTWMITKFEFGQRGALAPVDVYWYEGIAKPASEIAAEMPMNGSLFIGSKGKIAIAHGGHPQLLPKKQFKDFTPPEPYLPMSIGHHQQWIDACKTGNATGSHFGYAGPFTEIVLLGNIAHRLGESIHYDSEKMKVTNNHQANHLLSKEYRKGWEVRS